MFAHYVTDDIHTNNDYFDNAMNQVKMKYKEYNLDLKTMFSLINEPKINEKKYADIITNIFEEMIKNMIACGLNNLSFDVITDSSFCLIRIFIKHHPKFLEGLDKSIVDKIKDDGCLIYITKGIFYEDV